MEAKELHRTISLAAALLVAGLISPTASAACDAPAPDLRVCTAEDGTPESVDYDQQDVVAAGAYRYEYAYPWATSSGQGAYAYTWYSSPVGVNGAAVYHNCNDFGSDGSCDFHNLVLTANANGNPATVLVFPNDGRVCVLAAGSFDCHQLP